MQKRITKALISVLIIACMLCPLCSHSTIPVEAAAHTHTADCYLGTKHVHTGSSSSGTGCYQGGSTSNSYCDGSKTHYVYTEYRKTKITTKEWSCSSCDATWTEVWSTDCTKVEAPVYDGYAHDWYESGISYKTGGSGSECDCSASKSGRTTSTGYSAETSTDYYSCDVGDATHGLTSSYGASCSYYDTTYSLNCGKSENSYYDANGNLCPALCGKIVVSLSAKEPDQDLEIGETPTTTATATFLDGHQELVECEYQTK